MSRPDRLAARRSPLTAPLRRWVAGMAVMLAAASPAHADLWSLESSVESRLETNDNVNLVKHSPGTVNSLSLSTALGATRRVENMATRLGLNATSVSQSGRGTNDRVDGRINLSQSLSLESDDFDVSAGYSQDFNNVVQTADVALSPGQRRTTSLAASWSHSINERLTSSAQVSRNETRYGQAVSNASDYTDTALGGGLSYRLTEIDALNLQLSHSEYRPVSLGNRSSTDQWSLGVSHQWSERSSSSVSLGSYRTRTDGTALTLVCPLDVALCRAGLVPFIVVREPVTSAATGLQYSASYSYQLDEVSAISFSASRSQRPGGSGSVQRNDVVNLSASRSFSETWGGSLSYNMSRTSAPIAGSGGAFGVGESRQQSFAMSLSRQLADDLTLGLSYQRTQANNVGPSNSAQSSSVSVSLRYAFPTFDASR